MTYNEPSLDEINAFLGLLPLQLPPVQPMPSLWWSSFAEDHHLICQ
jgi:hypothetical protein